MSPPPKITRRTLTFGGVAAASVAVIAGAIYEVPKLLKHRASGRFADLVNRLDNPEQAALIGKAVRFNSMEGDFLPDGRTVEEIAAQDLRARLAKNTIPDLMIADSSIVERMAEVDGWVIPIVLWEFCILAAQST